MMQNEAILKVHRAEAGECFLAKLQQLSPAFMLVVGYTATVQIKGLSAAGITEELREFTAAADAEILAHGRARCLKSGVPSHPSGVPGPSIITRAAFDVLQGMPYVCVDAGLKHPPQMSGVIKLDGASPANALDSGHALAKGQARRLFEAGCELGESLGQEYAANGRYLIVAESVPGGTTTALGLLLALGFEAERAVSSSMPQNAHGPKLTSVLSGLAASGAIKGGYKTDPLVGVEAVGDPMQPAVAGIALTASRYCPVVLAGGSQMAAVLALALALGSPGQLALATTRWVWHDSTADLPGLARQIDARYEINSIPYFAANLNFANSKYSILHRYEQGFVKEGVGAGAAAMATFLAKNWQSADLLPFIEQTYERLVLKAGEKQEYAAD